MFSTITPTITQWRSEARGGHQPVNSYLVVTAYGSILIDPAADLTPQRIAECGARLPSAILLTHVQAEHADGGANFPGIPVWVPEGDTYLCEGIDAYLRRLGTWEPPWDWEGRGNYQGHMAGAANERPVRHSFTPAGAVKEGDAICGLRALATPGHGKHAVSYLLDTPDGVVAFCGDLVCGADGRLWNWFDCEWDYGCQGGQKALLASARRLLAAEPATLCPAHGDVITAPAACLTALARKLEVILEPPPSSCAAPVNFPDIDSPAPGFRMISPHLHQWRTGNLAVLLSDTGAALCVDDGLCNWLPLPERAEAHRATVERFKKALNISKVEIVVPTHYHGDHTENIPELVEMEGAEVVSLDLVAEPMEHPERFNLTCLLPWYGAAHEVVKVDRRVADGFRLRWHEYELEIFQLGGQTAHHAGVATTVDGQRVVFTGDSCFPNAEGCEPVICWNDAEPFSKGYAFAVERLLARAPDLLVSAHGLAQRDPLPYLLRKRDAWRAMRPVYESLSARRSLDEFFTPDSCEGNAIPQIRNPNIEIQKK